MDTYYRTAITRKPGKNFAEGLTTSKLGPPDYELMKVIELDMSELRKMDGGLTCLSLRF